MTKKLQCYKKGLCEFRTLDLLISSQAISLSSVMVDWFQLNSANSSNQMNLIQQRRNLTTLAIIAVSCWFHSTFFRIWKVVIICWASLTNKTEKNFFQTFKMILFSWNGIITLWRDDILKYSTFSNLSIDSDGMLSFTYTCSKMMFWWTGMGCRLNSCTWWYLILSVTERVKWYEEFTLQEWVNKLIQHLSLNYVLVMVFGWMCNFLEQMYRFSQIICCKTTFNLISVMWP